MRHAETVAKVLASGKTPAGTHRPIMVAEILAALAPQPGELAVDCTLGFGGHARELLARLQPGGRLLGLDADPIELPKTEARLREAGFGPEAFTAMRSNFAGLPQALAAHGARLSQPQQPLAQETLLLLQRNRRMKPLRLRQPRSGRVRTASSRTSACPRCSSTILRAASPRRATARWT